jgi:hypothetical protein
VNPRGVVFDAYLPRPGQAQADWQSGLQAKVKVRGTLNKRDDTDQGWQAEIAIPLSAVSGKSQATIALPPKPGQTWRANFFRTDQPKTGALQAWAWSPPKKPTFHALDRFGILVFADSQGKTEAAPDATKDTAGMATPAMKAGAAMKPGTAMKPGAAMKAGAAMVAPAMASMAAPTMAGMAVPGGMQ